MTYSSALHLEETLQKEEAHIAAGAVFLDGILNLPAGCESVVLFTNGGVLLNQSNRFITKELRTHGIGTFFFDLLTPEEDVCYRKHFDIELLTSRLTRGLIWLRAHPDLKNASIGLFGINAGAAAVLRIAAHSTDIGAVVTRCGRPDLAENDLRFVRCPTLFIAGGRDYDVLRLNRHALEMMSCRKELTIIPAATSRFEEPGAVETASRVSARWFSQYLGVTEERPASAIRIAPPGQEGWPKAGVVDKSREASL
jgi:pimeloyl-ACP methyl ester carboxylesterase